MICYFGPQNLFSVDFMKINLLSNIGLSFFVSILLGVPYVMNENSSWFHVSLLVVYVGLMYEGHGRFL